ncbi:hypothetical protein ACVIGA_000621 [Bradyrhizobium sp. USDA 3240]
MSKESDAFEREKTRFEQSTDFAISVSKLYAGRTANMPVLMASYVFTRICIGADSLRYLVQRDIEQSIEATLDHYSISVIARNIIEASLMFHYLMQEGVSDEEWSLRGKVLYLHDATLKLRLFKSMNATEQYQLFKQAAAELREEIKNAPAYAGLDPTRQERILTGQELYLGGLRSTLRLADVDAAYFDGMYAYLSSQVHIAPTSFLETNQRLGFSKPANYQYYFAAYALGHARIMLLRAAIRLAESISEIATKVDNDTLQSITSHSATDPGR